MGSDHILGTFVRASGQQRSMRAQNMEEISILGRDLPVTGRAYPQQVFRNPYGGSVGPCTRQYWASKRIPVIIGVVHVVLMYTYSNLHILTLFPVLQVPGILSEN